LIDRIATMDDTIDRLVGKSTSGLRAGTFIGVDLAAGPDQSVDVEVAAVVAPGPRPNLRRLL
jgi:hypothetical protein